MSLKQLDLNLRDILPLQNRFEFCNLLLWSTLDTYTINYSYASVHK